MKYVIEDDHIHLGHAHLRLSYRTDGRPNWISTTEEAPKVWMPTHAQVALIVVGCIEEQRAYAKPKPPLTEFFVGQIQEIAEMTFPEQLDKIGMIHHGNRLAHGYRRR